MSIRDGGPAFSFPGEPGIHAGCAGMSLRDYFASDALTLGGEFFHTLGSGCHTAETIAIAAYQIADAMLKEREL